MQVEDALTRIAGDKAPPLSVAENFPKERQKVAGEWRKWWTGQEKNLNLLQLNRQESYLGIRVVCEYDQAGRWNSGRVWECGPEIVIPEGIPIRTALDDLAAQHGFRWALDRSLYIVD